MIPTFLIRPLLYLAGVGAILAGLWYLHHRIDSHGYQRGLRETTALYQARDAKAQSEADALAEKLRGEVRAKEAKAREENDKISAALAKTKEENARSVAILNQRIANGFRLRDPYPTSPKQDCTGGMPKTGTDTNGVKEPSAGGLSIEATQFLSSEASRADEVATLLNSCIARLKVGN